MADLRPVYLLSGNDQAKIDAWRRRVRRRAEAEGGPGALELFDAVSSSAADVASALATLTFAAGDRYLLVDGVESWSAGELERLERALSDVPPGTVLVLIARGKVPATLPRAVRKAGGEVREYAAPKPWEMHRWAAERAQDEGLHLDSDAAKALVATVGQRQQRLAREIERLAILAHPRTQLSAEEVERLAVGDISRPVHDLADALVAGDGRLALGIAEERMREERPAGLIYAIVRRLRDVRRAAELLDAGLPASKVSAALRMPPWAAKRIVSQAERADREALERALCVLADLELDLRGGAELDEESALSLALARAAGSAA